MPLHDRKGSIYDLKQLIEEESAISAAHQVLVWNGKVLTNNNVLRDYEIDNLDTITLTLSLHGGSQGKKLHKRKKSKDSKEEEGKAAGKKQLTAE